MRAFAESGASYVTLGLAPLSERATNTPQAQPWSVRLLLRWARAHGRRFYNFDGLDTFKAKFQPESYEPVYAISVEKRTSLRTLYAVAGAFSGTEPVLFVARALLGAAHEEVLRLIGWLRATRKPTA